MELEPYDDKPKQARSGADADVYEMLWDCEYCGTKKLLGLSHRFCPNCGAGQNQQKRYFPPEEEKVAVKDHPYQGADRICPSCRNPNGAKAQFCGQCGTPLTGAASVKTKADQIRPVGAKEFAEVPTPATAPLQKPNRLWWGIAAAIAVVIALMLTNAFWTRSMALSLDHFAWERTIKIESFLPRQQGAWCDTMPHDAYSVSRREEVRSQRQVPDGEICHTRRVDRGDGTYEERQECKPKYRNEPVYDQYCSFTVNRWDYARSIVTQSQDQNPYWGAVNLGGAGQCIGCERESSRRESFILYFKSHESQEYHCEVPFPLWSQAQPHSTWSIRKGRIWGNVKCDSLKPA